MGGGTYMIFSWHVTPEECAQECLVRKEELQAAVNFFPVYIPAESAHKMNKQKKF